MSRSYKFAVEVSGITSEVVAEAVQEAIEQEMGATINLWVSRPWADKTVTVFFDGDCVLCGGELESEANKRLATAIFEVSDGQPTEVVTKWLCTEYQEWDSEYTSNRTDFIDTRNK